MYFREQLEQYVSNYIRNKDTILYTEHKQLILHLQNQMIGAAKQGDTKYNISIVECNTINDKPVNVNWLQRWILTNLRVESVVVNDSIYFTWGK